MAELIDIKEDLYPVFIPDDDEIKATQKVMGDYVRSHIIMNRVYNQFNGRRLYQAIDDWTKRWNGFIPAANPLLDEEQSRIFLNFTRNQVIAYVSKTALNLPKIIISAVNKKSGVHDKRFAEILSDLNKYSSLEENGARQFFKATLECATKGTVIVYDGYVKTSQKTYSPKEYDSSTGKANFEKEERVLFDNCFQKIVPVEDFFISNAYEQDVQMQPFVIWREITTHFEAEWEYKKYDNFKYVKPGAYASLATEPTTFYRNAIMTELQANEVEIIRYYNRKENRHIVLINGIPIYNKRIPFKDGMYPFAVGRFEPFDNNFFWGVGFPQKIMGDQDLINTMWNMMVDKTEGSLLPYGLSSDLDDFVEDNVLEPNKIRKVGDIDKWKFASLPGVNSGEMAMLQQAMAFIRENSGIDSGSSSYSPKGGKLNQKQLMLKEQDAMQRIGFSSSLMEDFERDRVELRVHHILQFYSRPKIEKITGKNGKEIEQILYREIRLANHKLADGKTGQRIIKLIDEEDIQDENKRQKLGDDLSVLEETGGMMGVPTEALAISVDSFYDYNFSVQIVKGSSYERNQTLDQIKRQDYGNWRLSLAQIVPVDAEELVAWVDEAYDIDTDRFKPKGNPMQAGQMGQAGTDITQNPAMQNVKQASLSSAIA